MIGELRNRHQFSGKSGFKKLNLIPLNVQGDKNRDLNNPGSPSSQHLYFEEADIVKETMMAVTIDRYEFINISSPEELRREEKRTNVEHYKRFCKKFQSIPLIDFANYWNMIVFDENGFDTVNWPFDPTRLNMYYITNNGRAKMEKLNSLPKSLNNITVYFHWYGRYQITKDRGLTLNLIDDRNDSLVFVKMRN